MVDSSRSNEVTIAIFPLENLSEGNALDIFCKSFYIDLVTELSRFRQFQVIPCELVPEVQGAGYAYSIRGSFRFYNDILRINAQLINNRTGQVAWADRYEGEKDSLFSIQEDLLKEIVSSLQQQLNYNLLTQIRKKSPVNLTVYEHWLYGMEALKAGDTVADEKARVHFSEAIRIDPDYSLAYSGMSLTYFNEWSCQLWERWEISQKGAFEWAQKAIDLDEQNYVAALVLGRVFLYDGEYDKAEHYLRRAYRLNPNDGESLIQIASCFVFLGYVTEAENLYNKVVQMTPLNKDQYSYIGAFIALELGQFEKCIALGSARPAPWVDFPGMMAAAHFQTGDLESMRRWWKLFLTEFEKKILKGAPLDEKQALQWIVNISPYRGRTNLEPFWKYIAGKDIDLSARPVNNVSHSGAGVNEFFREDHFWRISFAGKTIQMPDVKGLHDIARLLDDPEKQIHCSELFGLGVVMGSEKMFDEKARRSYQKKILELREEITLSERDNDPERTHALQREYDGVVEHLSSSLGIRGNVRKTNDAVDKARSAVTWRIRKAIRKIEQVHPELSKHLSLSIKTGIFCSYDPERPLKWN